jgi:myo-inositol-1(or 4)-monophosphatase
MKSPSRVVSSNIRDLEEAAAEFAALAGAEITSALGSIFKVRYKTGAADLKSLRDPVSEIDSHVEVMIRKHLAQCFPEHGIVGEELAEHEGIDPDYVWAIDPIDGTTNFVNGFPLFAASIGVLHRGLPIVGAVWCSISHALRPGVYHARIDGKLRFDGSDVTPKINAGVMRRLAGVPVIANADEAGWETRKTGSAALECALVAAGLLEVASFASPNIWDVAAGVTLVKAGGGVVYEHKKEGWRRLEKFPARASTLRIEDLQRWRSPLIVGSERAVSQMCI